MTKEKVDELEQIIKNWWTERLSRIKKPDFSNAHGIEEIIDVVFSDYILRAVKKLPSQIFDPATSTDDLPEEYYDREKLRSENAELVEVLGYYGEFVREFEDRVKYADTTGKDNQRYGDLVEITKIWATQLPLDKRMAFQGCCPVTLLCLCWDILGTRICPVCHRYAFDGGHDTCSCCGWKSQGVYDSNGEKMSIGDYRDEFIRKCMEKSMMQADKNKN